MMRLRFHWRLMQGGQTAGATVAAERVAPGAALPDLDAQVAFCRQAERAGIDSLLVDMNSGKPDPMGLALSLALGTEEITFMVAARPG
jgi:alkanesulfonate monooxygenase